jgi:hypothetical protein
MKSKYLLISLFVMWSQVGWAGDPQVDLRLIESARQNLYTAAASEVANLNYVRMQLLAFEGKANTIQNSFAQLECQKKSLAACRMAVEKLNIDINDEITRLQQTISSDVYQNLIHLPVNNNIHLETLFTSQLATLTGLQDQLWDLRKKIAGEYAEAEFAEQLAAIQSANQAASKQLRCQTEGFTLANMISASTLDISQSQQTNDAFLVKRALGRIDSVSASLKALRALCDPTSLTFAPSLELNIKSLTAKASSLNLTTLFAHACLNLSKAPDTIQKACQQKQPSDSMFFAVHQYLLQPNGAKL